MRIALLCLAAAALGAAAVLASIGPWGRTEPAGAGGAPAAAGPDTAAAPAVPATVAPAADAAPAVRRRAGHVFTLDEAMRELHLIRPGKGRAAEDFRGNTTDGRAFRLAEQRGKAVLINFWATWCAPCREEMPALERLWRHHRDAGFVVVAVALDRDVALVPPFVAEHRLSFPIVLDPDLQVANAYGVRALPTTLLVDRQGQVRALALGPRAWDNDAAHSLVEGLTR